MMKTLFRAKLSALFLLLGMAASVQAADVPSWSTTAGNNNSASPDGWPENMAPSGVNDSGREVMAAIKRWYDDIQPSIETTGSSNTYAFAASQTISAYTTGHVFAFIANHANSGTASLNVDSVGAKEIVNADGSGLVSGAIYTGQHVIVSYDATGDVFQMLSGNADLNIPVPVSAGGTGGTTAQTGREGLAAAATGANTFTAAQTITIATSGASADVNADDLTVENSGSTGIGILVPDAESGRLSVEAASGHVGHLRFAWNGGTPQGILETNGTDRVTVGPGVQVGSPTGGDQGAGTINATAVYDDGVLLGGVEIFTSATQALSFSATTTVAHGLSSTPDMVQLKLINLTADVGYAPGDTIVVTNNSDGAAYGFAVTVDATNVIVNTMPSYEVVNKVHALSAITAASWALIIEAIDDAD